MVLLSIVLVPLLLLCLSVDSPFYEVWGRIDSSWYFTAGKGWFSGMVPYVDFTDSKGPLLWLIYGLGSAINHYNYVGVWLLTCVSYFVTMWLIYGISHIFIENKWLCFVVSLLMLAVYFNSFIHDETRAEDFCQPFIALSVWSACRLAYSIQSSKRFKRSAWLIGISIGATLMIKFTFAIMIFFFAIMLCVMARRSELIRVRDVVWRLLAGVFIVCLPFIVAFAIMGNLDDFFREYFLITSKISSHSPRLNIIKWVLQGGFLSGLIIVMSISTLTMFINVRRYAWMPIVAFVWFLLVTVQNAEWDYYYYSCMIFGVFGLISLAKWLAYYKPSKGVVAVVVLLAITGVGAFSYYKASQFDNFKLVKHKPNHFFDTKRVEYHRHVDVVKQVNNPRIVFFNCNNVVNVADETGGLPGCKYFAKQYGASDDMIESQYNDIKHNRPHFVYVKAVETECLRKVEGLGYYPVLGPGEIFKVYLFARPDLQGIKVKSN